MAIPTVCSLIETILSCAFASLREFGRASSALTLSQGTAPGLTAPASQRRGGARAAARRQ